MERLNAQLPAERTSHERWVEETRAAGVREVEGMRERYEGEVAALRAEMEGVRERYEGEVATLRADAEKMEERHGGVSISKQEVQWNPSIVDTLGTW